jgi:hypothetical protein
MPPVDLCSTHSFVPLPDYGWTEEQAQGLFERLNLDGGPPNWKREHLQRLRSWCSAHGKDPATVDGQLEFVADDLGNTYEGVGMALRRATTVREAKAAVAPCINRLMATAPSGLHPSRLVKQECEGGPNMVARMHLLLKAEAIRVLIAGTSLAGSA